MPAEATPGQALTDGQRAYEGMCRQAAADEGPPGRATGWDGLKWWQWGRWHAAAEAVAVPLRAELAEQSRQREQLLGERNDLAEELQAIHDILVTAYGREDLSEDTPAVVAAMAAEWGRARQELAAAADALWEIAKTALTVKPNLDKPYPDAPELSPWTRWMEPRARRAHDAAMRIRKLLKDPLAAQPRLAGGGSQGGDEVAETDRGLMAASGDLEDPSVLRDLLLVAGEDIPLERISAWTPMQRGYAAEWAAREHLHASDNEVERIPRPAVLDSGGRDA